jgi:hypothetical protein
MSTWKKVFTLEGLRWIRHNPFSRLHAKFPLGLTQRLVNALMPRVSDLPIGADVEQVATRLSRISGDRQLNERRVLPFAASIGDRMPRKTRMVVRSEPNSLQDNHKTSRYQSADAEWHRGGVGRLPVKGENHWGRSERRFVVAFSFAVETAAIGISRAVQEKCAFARGRFLLAYRLPAAE